MRRSKQKKADSSIGLCLKNKSHYTGDFCLYHKSHGFSIMIFIKIDKLQKIWYNIISIVITVRIFAILDKWR